VKHVHDYLYVIEHDPLASRKSIHRDRAEAVIGFEPPFDLARDGFQVRLGRARADHEEIGKGRDALEIENDNLLRFFIRREVGASPG
jgi:hypothetical protein